MSEEKNMQQGDQEENKNLAEEKNETTNEAQEVASSEQVSEKGEDSPSKDEVTPQAEVTEEKEVEPVVEVTSEVSENKEGDEPKEKKLETEDDLHSEDEDEDEEDHEEELPDYSEYSREQLVEAIEELAQQTTFKRTDRVLAEIVPLFEEMEQGMRTEALEKYTADGGEEDSFEFRHDELFNRFDASHRLIRDRKHSFYKEKEEAKTRNLAKKEELLSQLRELVDGEEATTSIKPIKDIQEAWKQIGPVPPQHNKTLWANYNALLDRFFNNRHILFELKELDRKKNLEAKKELCEKAEALDKLDNIKDAVIQLNELHEEYKHVGPVPKEVQEELWQRFKTASDNIYRKRKDYLEDLKGELKENLVKKEALVQELLPFTDFKSDRINAWNAKTKEILAIQKKWDAIGGVPREKAKEINKGFWGSFKQFFAHKNEFFKTLEGQRKENLEKKVKLAEEAEELSKSEEWDKTSEQLKKLQRQWKEIGPVPEKKRNEIYERFKAACDAFFNNRRSHQNKAEAGYVNNQKAKEAIINTISDKAKEAGGSEAELMELVEQFNSIGFVPRNAIKTIESQFSEALEAYAGSLNLEENETESLVIRAEMTGLQSGPGGNRRLNKKEGALRRQISELEDNIALWRNNLTFFANSKTADKLKGEFDQKIDKAVEEVKELKKQLRILRSL
ncbi:DUF349 domain-containing protein [Roseivirga spongicola]|uniref:DUF349 domain-containing protein n=1 Tax=Roseivirga spongicola TaxID=333140 RepID=UPI002AC91FC2|nr:DUF349 domain-containing protein [Roseivirga spongicola]WPZ09579.1 DUF349 domain-containing protein [Roseivirga spongicola]